MTGATALLLLLAGLVLALLALAVLILRRLPAAGAGAALDQALREELRAAREESSREARALREEVAAAQKTSAESLVNAVARLGEAQAARLDGLAEATKRLEESNRAEQARVREQLDQKFRQIQENNDRKLDQMRQTVDEKLHSTLEKRLGESFQRVSERLEAVQRGLGEMRTLAIGVGDLKRVLTNVKERGTWGEFQLGAVLEQVLSPEQYARNVRTGDAGETVEFAVRLPGRGHAGDQPVWLPIDAKFPKEDYERLVEASQAGDAERVRKATDALLAAIEKSARDIRDRYIRPPATTDFAILFLPTEGLYAEALREPGFHDRLQQKYHVLPAGPTTLAAILNSLRVGFHTLAIEKRSSEVWQVLAAVKTEFGKFGEVLEKVRRQLSAASNTLDQTTVRTRAMERRLRSVESLPGAAAEQVLELPAADEQAAEHGGDAGGDAST